MGRSKAKELIFTCKARWARCGLGGDAALMFTCKARWGCWARYGLGGMQLILAGKVRWGR